MSEQSADPRRAVPRTDRVLADERLVAAAGRLGRDLVHTAVRAAQEACRSGRIAPETVAAHALSLLPEAAASLRPVLNATGVVVHTNLGRAPLSRAALEAVAMAAGTTDVELDLQTGRRGRRGAGAMAALAAAVPDAGGVHAVNNGAAALALAVRALCGGSADSGHAGERTRPTVVISRGEMVEIGDGFRIPELLESVGAQLREVGTTNRVRAADYAAAIDDSVGFVLKVHPSNFQVTGFTAAASIGELAALPELAEHRVPVVADVGSGLLAPHPLLPEEPDAASALRAGAHLVTASGDKLLGGPQAGLLLGEARLVERLRRHPFARAVRVDKLTLAALEATLRGPTSPVRVMLDADLDGLHARAAAIAAALQAAGIPARATDSRAAVGGGGAPGVKLPSAAVEVPEHYAAPLRRGPRPVVGYVRAGRLFLDLRTVPAEHDGELIAAVEAVGAALGPEA